MHPSPGEGPLFACVTSFRMFSGESTFCIHVSERMITNPLPVACELERWLRNEAERLRVTVTPIRFDESKEWEFIEGALRHRTGRFFSVIGVEARGGRFPEEGVSQPLVDQPEVGILGVLLRRREGEVEMLAQAKAEPGNIGCVHLAPTVQATRSNYERVHEGKPTPYLSYFLSEGERELDELQSEQGRFFLRKRNRNMAVWVSEEVEAEPGYRWTPLREVVGLLHRAHTVNSDLRSVLACMDWSVFGESPSPDAFGDSLRASLGVVSSEENTEVDDWFAKVRCGAGFKLERLPLDRLSGWEWTTTRLEDAGNLRFWVRQMDVKAPGREVAYWDQPMLGCRGETDEVLCCRVEEGMPRFAVALRTDAGVEGGVEMGLPRPAPAEGTTSVRFEVATSEEGGRFYQVVSRYQLWVVEGDVPFADEVCWMTLGQVKRQISLENRVSNELRGAVALLLPVMWGPLA